MDKGWSASVETYVRAHREYVKKSYEKYDFLTYLHAVRASISSVLDCPMALDFAVHFPSKVPRIISICYLTSDSEFRDEQKMCFSLWCNVARSILVASKQDANFKIFKIFKTRSIYRLRHNVLFPYSENIVF